jgi:hypothetical protein
MKWLIVVYAALLLSGCGEMTAPPGAVPEKKPCDLPGACEVAGIDLVIDELALAFHAGQAREPMTRLRYVQNFDSIPVRYRVRNRGDTPAPAASGRLMSCNRCLGNRAVTVPLEALGPGEVDSGTVWLPAPKAESQMTVAPVLLLDIAGAVDEPFYRNNERTTDSSYIVMVPELTGIFELLTPEVRIGKTARFIVTLINKASYGTLNDTTIAFCFRRTDIDHGIDTCNRPFAKRVVPRLAPGNTWRDSIEIELTQQMYYYEKHAAIPVRFDACLGGRVSYVVEPCAAGAAVTLLPDVESACAVPRIQFGVITSASFGQPCYVYLAQFNVWAFEARAGARYSASVTRPVGDPAQVGIWDSDGRPIGAEGTGTVSTTISKAGRYYLVVHRPYYTNNLDYTVRLDEGA